MIAVEASDDRLERSVLGCQRVERADLVARSEVEAQLVGDRLDGLLIELLPARQLIASPSPSAWTRTPASTPEQRMAQERLVGVSACSPVIAGKRPRKPSVWAKSNGWRALACTTWVGEVVAVVLMIVLRRSGERGEHPQQKGAADR